MSARGIDGAETRARSAVAPSLVETDTVHPSELYARVGDWLAHKSPVSRLASASFATSTCWPTRREPIALTCAQMHQLRFDVADNDDAVGDATCCAGWAT
uniref:Uncharacterized protein n=1 Tax=Plectus sambesii TaxID=2011161 RepID=A0A914VU81_9BILA